jgi:pilus assembly protein CpaB
MGAPRPRPQLSPSPVDLDLMREALREPEDDVPEDDFAAQPAAAPSRPFTAAPALPLADDPTPTFVVKPSEGRAARRGMDDLREQALRNVIAGASDPRTGSKASPNIRRGGSGILTPSRIILLSVALITGGVAAFLAAQLSTPEPAPVPEVIAAPTVQVLVAKDTIGIGQRVTASAVEWTEWPEASARSEFVTSATTPDAITEMEGAVARAEIAAGEPILTEKLVQPDGSYLAGVLDGGMRGVSVPITAAAASGGFIAPNDRVDVVATRNLEARKVTETILRNVRVLAINGQLGREDGEAAEGASEETFSGDTLVTLELNAAQSELAINAVATGELTLVLRSIADLADGQSAEQRTANQLIRATSPFWSK